MNKINKNVKNLVMRSALARFIDNLVVAVIIVMIGFVFFKQFVGSSLICLALASLVSFIFIFVIVSRQNSKLSRLSIEKNELKNVELYNFELRKLSEENQLNYFCNLFCTHRIERKKHCLVIDKTTLVYPCLKQDTLVAADIYAAVSLGYSDIVILCNKCETDIDKLISKFESKITIFTPLEIYALMKKNNCFLPIENQSSPKKKRFFLSQTFMKKRAKDFIRIGFLLYLMALFVPFTKYYLVSASISLILGVFCLIFGKREVKKAKVLPFINN